MGVRYIDRRLPPKSLCVAHMSTAASVGARAGRHPPVLALSEAEPPMCIPMRVMVIEGHRDRRVEYLEMVDYVQGYWG